MSIDHRPYFESRPGVRRIENAAAVAYLQDGPKLTAAVFIGKALKPAFHYAFRDNLARDSYVERTLADALAARARREAQKEKTRADRNRPNELKVGDILVCSWGYEQTNVDFYAVRAVAGLSVTLQKIGARIVRDTGWASADVEADATVSIGAPFKKRVCYGSSVRMTSYSSASKWSGRPVHQSSYH